MNYENRRYLIIPTSITGSIDFTQVLETSIDTLRLSIDGTKTFVKYTIHTEGNVTEEEQETEEEVTVYGRPDIYLEEYNEYTHEEILEVLFTEEWTSTEGDIER